MTGHRPTPPHGTIARARGTNSGSRPPCHCLPCTTADRRANKQYKVNYLLGRKATTPIGPVSDHVHALLDAGWTQDAIAQAAGVVQGTVSNIARRTTATVHKRTARRILTVPVRPRTRPMTDATGSVRRLQALMTIGHPLTLLATESGLPYTYACDLIHGRKPRLATGLVERIHTLYDVLKWCPGKSKSAATIARKYGWHDPLEWADINMDDPLAEPRLEEDEPPQDTPADTDDLDYQAIHKALTGDRVHLTPAEQKAAVVEGRLRGIPRNLLATMPGLTLADTIRIWETATTKARRHGTPLQRLPQWYETYAPAA